MSGKNYKAYFALIIIILTVPSFAQHQISVAPAIGLYIYNSENSLPVMGDKNYLLNYGFKLSYENKNLIGYDIQFSYSFIYSNFDSVLNFEIYDPSPDPIPYRFFSSNVWMSINNFDVSFNYALGTIFSIGIGPTFSFVNRSVEVDRYNFIDRLSSFCIGLNGLIELQVPISSEVNYWFFYSSLKFRYLYGLLYDEGLRDLDDYNQNFVTANLAIGIGYNF